MVDHAARAARSVADRARADWAALLSATVDQHRPVPAVQDRIDRFVRELHQGQRRQSLAQAMAAIGAHLDLPTHQRVTGRVGCSPTVAVLDESHPHATVPWPTFDPNPYATVRDIAARHLAETRPKRRTTGSPAPEPPKSVPRSTPDPHNASQPRKAETAMSDEPTHFAPYGATNAACDETVPRSVMWNASAGEYTDPRFTTRRSRTTCMDCRFQAGITKAELQPTEPSPGPPSAENWHFPEGGLAPVVALLTEIRDRLPEPPPTVTKVSYGEHGESGHSDGEPLAEPIALGSVVVDKTGSAWVQIDRGHWTSRQNAEGVCNWLYVKTKGPLRLPTAEERAEWGISATLPDGHVAVPIIERHDMWDVLARDLRVVAGHGRAHGYVAAPAHVIALADALDQEQGR